MRKGQIEKQTNIKGGLYNKCEGVPRTSILKFHQVAKGKQNLIQIFLEIKPPYKFGQLILEWTYICIFNFVNFLLQLCYSASNKAKLGGEESKGQIEKG